jgi:DNA (cytosine-5)-methyltransferase 1
MKVLDLFCGAGGASVGLHRAGFEVHGVDLNAQTEYPFEFTQADALKWNEWDYDLIWASPPCQAYSWGTVKWRNKGKQYVDLVAPTRELLLKTGKPFVLENVVGSPLRKDLILCGEMFGLRVIRHRVFEIHGFQVEQPHHKKHKGSVWHGEYIGVWSGGKPGCFGDEEKRKYYCTVAGHGGDGGKGNCSLKAWQEAMGINWINNKKTLAQCVPPAYSEYIANQFKELSKEGANSK